MLYFAFLSHRNSPYDLEWGGGGANSLDSPKIADNSDFESDKIDAGLRDKEETITEYTYKTYDDYFTDYNITAETITEQDFTGTGSATAPYVVHSTKGFLWLMNPSYSKISLSNKYLEIECDIVLNDEVFNQYGEIQGGDGVVYNWNFSRTALGLEIDGNGYFVYGFFLKCEVENATVSMFSSWYKLKKVENWNFNSFYVYGANSSTCSVIAAEIEEVNNCKIYLGYVCGSSQASSLAFRVHSISNCENRANVYGKRVVSGLVQYLTGKMEYCCNYGNIFGYSYDIGGMVAIVDSGSSIIIQNCQNYGQIKSETNSYVGGIIAYIKGYSGIIKNCGNWGLCYVRQAICGGIIGNCSADYCLIYQCSNYSSIMGSISSWALGSLVGQVNKTRMDIEKCISFSEDVLSLVGQSNNSATSIQKTRYYLKNLNTTTLTLFSRHIFNSDLLIKDCDIKIEGEKITKLFMCQETSDNISSKVYIKNVLMDYENKNLNIALNDFEHIQDCIVINNLFYGSDFSSFCVDFKTGKLGIKALSGKGFYQGEINEGWLIQKGYKKKVI